MTRVHGPRRVLKELRRLIIKNHRALEHRATTAEERTWCQRVHDALDRLIVEGDAVLPGLPDPRDYRRVRKRPGAMFVIAVTAAGALGALGGPI